MKARFRPLLLLGVATILCFLPGDCAAQSATATGISRDFNPAISVNTLLLYTSGPNKDAAAQGEKGDGGDGHADGFSIQETEIRFAAYVDPFARGDFTFSMHGSEGFELEEGYVHALSLPRGAGLRAGKFLWEFGKHNGLHTHQFPFVERPVAWDQLLGEEAFNGAAIEASWLTPLSWYAEVLLTAFPLIEPIHGDPEPPSNKWGGAGRLRQLWDATDRATIDLGFSYAGGAARLTREQGPEEVDRHFFAADLAYKWSGAGRYPKKLELQGEWLRRLDDRDGEDLSSDGFYAHALARVSRRLSLGLRYDLYLPEELDGKTNDDISTWTASLAFVPSEFQAMRVDFLHQSIGDDSDQGIRVQMNFTIGSHPAHRY